MAGRPALVSQCVVSVNAVSLEVGETEVEVEVNAH